MSPEQAEGRPLDSRSDIFAFGVVLYEVLSGQRPFRGDTTLATLASILREDPVTLRQLRPEIPAQLERIVQRCMAKNPADRYASAAGVGHDLERLRKPEPAGIVLRRPVVAAIAAMLLIAVGGMGIRSFVLSSRALTAQTETIPKAAELLEKSRPLAALRLLREAEKYAPASAELIRLKEDLSVLAASVETTPPGAEIYATDYADPEAAESSHWEHLGPSPLQTDKLPRDGSFRVRIIKDGYETVEATLPVNRSMRVLLHTKEETPAGMTWIPLRPPEQLRVTGVELPAV